MFVDREISCLDCAQPFVFTAGEQEFYDRKGFKEEPKRCKPCRDNRKAKRSPGVAMGGSDAGYTPNRRPAATPAGAATGYGTGNGYNGNGVGAADDDDDDDIGNRLPQTAAPVRGPREVRTISSGPSNGSSNGTAAMGGGGAPRRELHDATCGTCGVATRVPFKPVAGRPVYCRDCYGARRVGGTP
jgi:CxxC-x17-CxxC domain-containing protein